MENNSTIPKADDSPNVAAKFGAPGYDQIAESLSQLSQSAIKSAIVINGGACIAILGLIGATWNSPNGPLLNVGIGLSLLCYAVGVFFGAIAAWANYNQLVWQAQAISSLQVELGMDPTGALASRPDSMFKGCQNRSDMWSHATFVFLSLACLAFLVGTLMAFVSMMCQIIDTTPPPQSVPATNGP